MIPLYTQNEFINSKADDLLPLECYFCKKIFKRPKKEIKYEIKHKRGNLKYCNRTCMSSKNSNILVNCLNCNTLFTKYINQIIKSPNHFCSHSCHATYNNTHKSKGYRRSKLEIWLEAKLPSIYPNLEFQFNRKDAINSELDIYIPSLSLAFELNGIFHYEPIYGPNKLNQIQNNDQNKFQKCQENKIDLCIIDTSGQKYFKPNTSQKYLDIIVNIINQRTPLTS